MYDKNGQRYGFQYKNGSTTAYYYYIYNGQGDVIGILNSSGSLVAEYAYNAWGQHTAIRDGNGNPVSSSNTTHIANLNPFRYRGYYYDTESYFYYLNSRYYDAKTGRFINADGQINDDVLGTNLFAYCSNNPVNRADNEGEFWHILAGAVVGGLINGAVKAVSNVIEGKSVTDGLGTAMLAGAASGALASSGVGLVGSVVGNAAISMAENAVNQVIKNNGFNNFDAKDMAIDGTIGGISGAIGGAGKGTKHLMNLGKQSVKRTINQASHQGIKAGLKEGSKAASYYVKSSKGFYKNMLKELRKDIAVSGGVAFSTSDFAKEQYNLVIWG